ncbi:MAG: hypothetical protein RIC35_09650 [Marinoscillum sp.]
MIKPIMATIVFMVVNLFVYGQDDFKEIGYMDRGDMVIEITGSPFDSESLLSFGSFRARYAATDVVVPRLGVSVDFRNSQTSPDVVINSNTYQINFGIEYHLRIEGGFRSYFYVDGIFGQRNSSRESTTSPSVDGAINVPSSYFSTVSNRGYLRYGGGMGFGAEYHLTSRFYFGTEIGFQFTSDKNKEVTVDNELVIPSTQTNFGGLNTQNVLRIGFKLF